MAKNSVKNVGRMTVVSTKATGKTHKPKIQSHDTDALDLSKFTIKQSEIVLVKKMINFSIIKVQSISAPHIALMDLPRI